MNPLSLSHARLGVCTLAKTFFCGWGPQKYEWGAPRFLQSSIAILSFDFLIPQKKSTPQGAFLSSSHPLIL